MANDKMRKAEEIYRKGIEHFESGDEDRRIKGLKLIQKAAEMGLEEAVDWVDDYSFDDDAGVQGES
ncbi:MAG: hypothetical protein K6B65_03440 [Bacilli bacterium]|nr:hypothetical protein [Bacilli bacterium]